MSKGEISRYVKFHHISLQAQIVDVEEPSAKKQKLEGTADAVIS